ncbi:MAG: MlaD family protein [Solirubrobacteraceae bacterium]|nr:MlaD family protein [Solirubrobacteraceae bacterium]
MIGPRTGLPGRIVALGLFVASCLVVALLLLQAAGGIDLEDRYRVEVVVPTALQLADNADVRHAGVTVGKVRGISSRGSTAVLGLALDRDHAPIHDDAVVRVRFKTLVGENYVELDPGTRGRPTIPDGGRLGLRNARESTQLGDVLSTLGPRRRARVRSLLDDLGRGVGDRRAVGRGISGISELLLAGKRLVPPVDRQRLALRALVGDLATTLATLDRRGAQIRRLTTAARRSATAIRADADALRAGLAELPSTLRTTDRTAGRLAAVGDRARPVLDDLGVALDRLSPVVARLRTVAPRTLTALRRLESAAPAGRTLLNALRTASPSVAAALPPSDVVLRDLRPMVAYAAPYARDVGMGLGGLAQGVGTRDATSHLARLQPIVNPEMLPLLGADEREAIQRLLGPDLARNLTLRGQNALPAPNTFATPRPWSGAYPRVERDPASAPTP